MTERPLRVLFAARWYPSHDARGRGSFIADQVHALRRAGVEIVVASWEPALVATPADPGAVARRWARSIVSADDVLATPRSWGAGVPVARLPAVVPADADARHPVDLGNWQAATLVAFGRRLAERWPFDVIHAHTGLPDGVAAAALADELGLPLVTTEHDGSLDRRLADERARAAYRTLVGKRRRLVAVSSRLADQAAALSGLPRDAIGVIPNLIDRSLFHPDPSVRRDHDELLWVGNRKLSKGMRELIQAFAQLAAGRPALHLRLIGSAASEDDERALEAEAVDLGVRDRVAFEAATSREGVARAMARAGLFVHPSPSESFGVVAIEALASGLPVVARAPTIVDLLGTDGSLGEIPAGTDVASFADAIDRALRRRDRVGVERLVAAAEPFDEARVAARILALYREVVDVDAVSGPAGGGPELAASRPPIARAIVVAGRRRSATRRIAALPSGVAETLTVVTAAAPGSEPPTESDPTPSVARWIELDADAPWRARFEMLGGPAARTARPSPLERALRAVSHPRQVVQRRRLFRRRAEMAIETRARTLAAASSELPPGMPVIALDGDDIVAIDRAGLGARLAPAILRWVADRADEGPCGGP